MAALESKRSMAYRSRAMSQPRSMVKMPAAKSAIGKRRSAAKEDSTAVYQKRRKEIAEAAVRVFNKRGFTGASISAVAEELEIDRASLYYYISSKEELFDEIIREVNLIQNTLARQ